MAGYNGAPRPRTPGYYLKRIGAAALVFIVGARLYAEAGSSNAPDTPLIAASTPLPMDPNMFTVFDCGNGIPHMANATGAADPLNAGAIGVWCDDTHGKQLAQLPNISQQADPLVDEHQIAFGFTCRNADYSAADNSPQVTVSHGDLWAGDTYVETERAVCGVGQTAYALYRFYLPLPTPTPTATQESL